MRSISFDKLNQTHGRNLLEPMNDVQKYFVTETLATITGYWCFGSDTSFGLAVGETTASFDLETKDILGTHYGFIVAKTVTQDNVDLAYEEVFEQSFVRMVDESSLDLAKRVYAAIFSKFKFPILDKDFQDSPPWAWLKHIQELESFEILYGKNDYFGFYLDEVAVGPNGPMARNSRCLKPSGITGVKTSKGLDIESKAYTDF